MPFTFTAFLAGHGGEFAALITAIFWAMSAMAFSHVSKIIPALEVNLLKSLIGAIMVGLTLAAFATLPFGADPIAMWLFFLSGAIGIGVGDSGYLAGMTYLGVRKVLLLGTLAPPITALIALVFLGERLSFTAWMGILLTAGGVAWVVTERQGLENGLSRRGWRLGVAFGLLSAVSQAVASVVSRAAYARDAINPLGASFLRLLSAVVVLGLILAASRLRPCIWLRQPRPLRTGGYVLLGTFLGPYIGASFLQVALKFAPAGIVQTLVATNPLFALVFAAMAGERISLRAVLGALVVLLGVALLFGLL